MDSIYVDPRLEAVMQDVVLPAARTPDVFVDVWLPARRALWVYGRDGAGKMTALCSLLRRERVSFKSVELDPLSEVDPQASALARELGKLRKRPSSEPTVLVVENAQILRQTQRDATWKALCSASVYLDGTPHLLALVANEPPIARIEREAPFFAQCAACYVQGPPLEARAAFFRAWFARYAAHVGERPTIHIEVEVTADDCEWLAECADYATYAQMATWCRRVAYAITFEGRSPLTLSRELLERFIDTSRGVESLDASDNRAEENRFSCVAGAGAIPRDTRGDPGEKKDAKSGIKRERESKDSRESPQKRPRTLAQRYEEIEISIDGSLVETLEQGVEK